jgi:hypothetical protein
MYIRIVTFSLTISREEYLAITEQVAPAFLAWPGLQAKYWLSDETAGRYGGIYVFGSKEAADASRESDLFSQMATNPAFTDMEVVEYDVLDGPSAVTAVAPPGYSAA